MLYYLNFTKTKIFTYLSRFSVMMIKKNLPIALLMLWLLSCNSESAQTQAREDAQNLENQALCKDYLICDNEDWIVCLQKKADKTDEFFLKSRRSGETMSVNELVKKRMSDLKDEPLDLSCAEGKDHDFKINGVYLISIGQQATIETLKIAKK